MLTYRVTQQAEQGQAIFNGMLIEWDAIDAPEWLFFQMCPSWLIKLLLISRAGVYLLYPCLLSIFLLVKIIEWLQATTWTVCVSYKSIKTFQLPTPSSISENSALNCRAAPASSHKMGTRAWELWEVVGGKEGLFLFLAVHPFISGMASHYSVMGAHRNLSVVLSPLGMISGGWLFSFLVLCLCSSIQGNIPIAVLGNLFVCVVRQGMNPSTYARPYKIFLEKIYCHLFFLFWFLFLLFRPLIFLSSQVDRPRRSILEAAIAQPSSVLNWFNPVKIPLGLGE